MAGDQFENLEHVYSQLSPDQQSAVARDFMEALQKENSPLMQKFAGMDPSQINPKQLAQMHQEAREKHPGVLSRMMHHPIIAGVLGAFAAYEIDKHLTKH